MKRLINYNNKCMLMVVRIKDDEAYDSFKCYIPSHKKQMFYIVSNYDDIFRNQVDCLLKEKFNMRSILKNMPLCQIWNV